FFFQAEDGIRDRNVTGVQTCALPISARGQYIFALAGGCACHTVPKGTLHAGTRAFPIPFGTVYSTNITQDKETGLGNWTDQQIRSEERRVGKECRCRW